MIDRTLAIKLQLQTVSKKSKMGFRTISFLTFLLAANSSTFAASNIDVAPLFQKFLAPLTQDNLRSIGQSTAEFLASRIFTHFDKLSTDPAQPRIPILPELPEVIRLLNASKIEMVIPITELLLLGLKAELLTPLEVHNLNQLTDNLYIDLGMDKLELGWRLEAPSIEVFGDYEASLFLGSPPVENPTIVNSSLSFSATEAKMNVDNFFFGIIAKADPFPIHHKINFTSIDVRLGSWGLEWISHWLIKLESPDGIDTPLDETTDIGPAVHGIADTLWRLLKGTVNEALLCPLTYVMGDCTVIELVNITEPLGCLRFDLEYSGCFGEIPSSPPTEPTSQPTEGPTDQTNQPPVSTEGPTDQTNQPPVSTEGPSDKPTTPTAVSTTPDDSSATQAQMNVAVFLLSVFPVMVAMQHHQS